jgi:hypothetical protein
VHCEADLELCLEQDFEGRRLWCWFHRILYAQDGMVEFSQIFLIGKNERKSIAAIPMHLVRKRNKIRK